MSQVLISSSEHAQWSKKTHGKNSYHAKAENKHHSGVP